MTVLEMDSSRLPATARALFDDSADGERLMALFESFERGAEIGTGLRLGLNARLVTPGGERRVRLGGTAMGTAGR